MVLVRCGCTKQCENSVAGGLHDETTVAVYGVYHQLECGIDKGTRLIRVEVLHQLHRALDVGEQCGDGFALTVERTVGLALV